MKKICSFDIFDTYFIKNIGGLDIFDTRMIKTFQLSVSTLTTLKIEVLIFSTLPFDNICSFDISDGKHRHFRHLNDEKISSFRHYRHSKDENISNYNILEVLTFSDFQNMEKINFNIFETDSIENIYGLDTRMPSFLFHFNFIFNTRMFEKFAVSTFSTLKWLKIFAVVKFPTFLIFNLWITLAIKTFLTLKRWIYLHFHSNDIKNIVFRFPTLEWWIYL